MVQQNEAASKATQKPMRLKTGVVLLLVQWLLFFIFPKAVPSLAAFGVLGGVLGGLAILIWWLFFSRAPRLDRWGGLVVVILAVILTPYLLDETLAGAGQGFLFYMLVFPGLGLAIVAGTVIGRRFSPGLRRFFLAALILLACGFWATLRMGGLDNSFNPDFSWRWIASPEERLLAQIGDAGTLTESETALAETAPEWPGFRGPNRDGIVHGVSIGTDWAANPPVALWRRPVGPGWSSFSVHGNLIYTQEQLGEEEAVTCYDIATGEPVWRHTDPARFWEANGGAGPRGTPTLHKGRVYTLGGTGIVNALNAADGSVIWSRNDAKETDTQVPIWGFSGSPLVVDDAVVVALSGALIAYDREIGAIRWVHALPGDSYSSPQLLTLAEVPQIVFQNKAGATAYDPVDGKKLWAYAWEGYPIVQPALTDNGDVLVSVDERSGVRRLSVVPADTGWTVSEVWSTARVRPYFNDSALHQGYIYGFDGVSLACVDLSNGERMWKGGRYGRGQFILLADQDLILVLSEKGELALVQAVPGGFTELAKIPGIEGKTWNHPVLVGDVLLVRNAQEMAAFRMPPVEAS